jgi:hypothetical protein
MRRFATPAFVSVPAGAPGSTIANERAMLRMRIGHGGRGARNARARIAAGAAPRPRLEAAAWIR